MGTFGSWSLRFLTCKMGPERLLSSASVRMGEIMLAESSNRVRCTVSI